MSGEGMGDSLRFEPNEKGTVYRLVGDLTFASALSALGGANQVLDPQIEGVGFDLSGIKRVDSAGVALLIEWLQMARKTGCHLTFSHIPKTLYAIMQVNGVEAMVPLAHGTDSVVQN